MTIVISSLTKYLTKKEDTTMAGPKLSIEDQIADMQKKGITFEKVGIPEAKRLSNICMMCQLFIYGTC